MPALIVNVFGFFFCVVLTYLLARNDNNQGVLTVETTQLEIDPRILEEERIEEELLRKELEEELIRKLIEEEQAKNKLKSDTTAAMNEMLSKKHNQSTISIRYEIFKFS